MKIICAGMPKTGTKSIAQALRMLGFVVYDFKEHFEYHINEYDQLFSTGKMPDFASMYSKVDAVIATPAYSVWKELKETFPEAKVVLMERDSVDTWLKSYIKTRAIVSERGKKPLNFLGLFLTPTGRRCRRIINGARRKVGFSFDLLEHGIRCVENYRQVYERHNSRVKSLIPREDLLVYNVEQGWKPLCDFLGLNIPDLPFPTLNANSETLGKLLDSAVFEKIQTEMLQGTVILIMIAIILILFVTIYI